MHKKIIIFIVSISLLSLASFAYWGKLQYNNKFFDANFYDIISVFKDLLIGIILAILLYVNTEKNNNDRQLILVIDEILKGILIRLHLPPIRLSEIDKSSKEIFHMNLIEKTKISNDINLLRTNIQNDVVKTNIETLQNLINSYYEYYTENFFMKSSSITNFKDFIMDSNKKMNQIENEIQKLRFCIYTNSIR